MFTNTNVLFSQHYEWLITVKNCSRFSAAASVAFTEGARKNSVGILHTEVIFSTQALIERVVLVWRGSSQLNAALNTKACS